MFYFFYYQQLKTYLTKRNICVKMVMKKALTRSLYQFKTQPTSTLHKQKNIQEAFKKCLNADH